ncbi:enoyl-CoA hydratase/isomerase family protein [Rugamonas apoptosis]|uniref:Enoyl-CoA hydratase/isomerase family protein n=1 Tax=Rugamonas apoptosis TaxID=2758570 RepID=A0A7W2ILX7_9BURK|nr:enoyl-CoA hydratase/isomerase family protein [Rugamonas apoptosis]MBA5688922.1 enoyl-CoA hydratase/isomerase family protein [Rugamonas apoptosis]
MNDDVILKERHGNVIVLSMNSNPHNIMGPRLLTPLVAAMREAVEQGGRAIVLRSNLRNFCAGADVTLFDALIEEATTGKAQAPTMELTVLDILQAFEALPIPIVASVRGACLGGGLELALASDYVVAAASAKLGSVESALGLHPLMGGIQRQVQRIGLARAKEMSMLGRRYDAETLERWGLINLVVSDERLDAVALSVATELANGPTVAHAATKKIAAIAANEGVEAADLVMAELQKPIWASKDVKAGLASFLAQGPGLTKFEGC